MGSYINLDFLQFYEISDKIFILQMYFFVLKHFATFLGQVEFSNPSILLLAQHKIYFFNLTAPLIHEMHLLNYIPPRNSFIFFYFAVNINFAYFDFQNVKIGEILTFCHFLKTPPEQPWCALLCINKCRY